MLTINYENPACNTPNQCDTLALTCVDFRFWKPTVELLQGSRYGDLDLLSVPGSSKAVIDEAQRPVLFQSLRTVHGVHSTKRLIIVDHIDCGAYGGSVLFDCPESEYAYHVERLLQARDIISAEFPCLEVIPAYIDWNHLELFQP